MLVGETANFSCAFSGFPDASLIQWFREGVSDPVMDTSDRIGITVATLESELTIVTERDDHDTRYFCVATQILVTGETNATTTAATLTVQCKHIEGCFVFIQIGCFIVLVCSDQSDRSMYTHSRMKSVTRVNFKIVASSLPHSSCSSTRPL